MPKKKSLKDRIVRINLSRSPHPQKKIKMSEITDDARFIDIDLRSREWDPLPEMTKAIEKGGWPGGIRYVKKKCRRKR